ncbi:unnamed protein product [Caenorhabditis sp. 36 PRJEB53466]|nr:unnamed protein product [Caenorhabditis sp. 36 PRJEB53466]
MSSLLKTFTAIALISFISASPVLRSKRGSYGPPSNYGPPEGQFGSAYGQQQNYGQNFGAGSGGGYGRPSGSYGRPEGGYNRPQQYGPGGYQQGGKYPGGGGFQGGQGGFSQGGSSGFQGGQGGFSQGGSSGFQGGQGGFSQGAAGGFQGQSGGGFQSGQTGFQAAQPVPSVPTAGGQQPALPTDPDYSTVGQTAPVAAPGAGDSGLFGGGAATSGFDDPALAADAKPAGATITDSVSESSAAGRK